MVTRRQFLRHAGLLSSAYVFPGTCTSKRDPEPEIWVNDVHAQLNATRVRATVRPLSVEGLQSVVRDAERHGLGLCVAGGRHAMGGQQFLTDGVLVDTVGMNRVVDFDRERGLIEIDAGIQWPALFDYLEAAQAGEAQKWAIAQKQTGADNLTLGGALAANVHGRGLARKPFVADVESFLLVDPAGEARRCSRTENAELFGLVCGGYGLFGIVARITLRLVPRQKVERVVEVIDIADAASAFESRIADGFLYGDFQYSTDTGSDDFLRRGVFSCYRPADPAAPMPEGRKELSADDWRNLIYLGHVDRRRAWETYSNYYLSTSGQVYWSDEQQRSLYIGDYHKELDRQLGATVPATEMITEIYVPRPRLVDFMAGVRDDFRRYAVNVIYGTIRLIEPDDESFLAWARQPWACVIFNLHVSHAPEALAKAADDFRRLIDRGIEHGGSYYLTYHRWATRAQIERCYPRFPEFLRRKRGYDPGERFQSDWYRHHRTMFGDAA